MSKKAVKKAEKSAKSTGISSAEQLYREFIKKADGDAERAEKEMRRIGYYRAKNGKWLRKQPDPWDKVIEALKARRDELNRKKNTVHKG